MQRGLSVSARFDSGPSSKNAQSTKPVTAARSGPLPTLLGGVSLPFGMSRRARKQAQKMNAASVEVGGGDGGKGGAGTGGGGGGGGDEGAGAGGSGGAATGVFGG